ncbi:hypothetical protein ACFWY5_57080 [Nonomuraea sp. NPDC059007]|uniref:hypothetical protein n=1 Tax=Nonomuraea sp. NPDC059007 TaxID=3346692 RepID=UPI0036842CD5
MDTASQCPIDRLVLLHHERADARAKAASDHLAATYLGGDLAEADLTEIFALEYVHRQWAWVLKVMREEGVDGGHAVQRARAGARRSLTCNHPRTPLGQLTQRLIHRGARDFLHDSQYLADLQADNSDSHTNCPLRPRTQGYQQVSTSPQQSETPASPATGPIPTTTADDATHYRP